MPVPALARLRPARGLERAGLRRRLGIAARAAGGEKLRRAVDFDHWAAFQRLLRADARTCSPSVGRGERGKAPTSIVVLSGDVHHAYLAELGFPPAAAASTAPPTRPSARPTATRSTTTSGVRDQGRLLTPVHRAHARAGRAPPAPADPGLRWRLREGPFFDNQVATLRLDGREAQMKLDKTVPGRRALSATREVRFRALA